MMTHRHTGDHRGFGENIQDVWRGSAAQLQVSPGVQVQVSQGVQLQVSPGLNSVILRVQVFRCEMC